MRLRRIVFKKWYGNIEIDALGLRGTNLDDKKKKVRSKSAYLRIEMVEHIVNKKKKGN